MKKVHLSLLVLFLIPTAFVRADFTDVPLGHQNYDAIGLLEDYGIVQGYENGSFGVDELVSRGEFLKMVLLAEANNPNRTESATSALFPFGDEDEIMVDPFCFTDFDSTQWFEPYGCWAKEHGIMNGYPAGDFRALDSVNFAEAATILLGASNGYDFEPGEHHWAERYIDYLSYRMSIPTDIRSISQDLTRSQAAELIWRSTFASSELLKNKSTNVFYWKAHDYDVYELLGYSGERRFPYYYKDGQMYRGELGSQSFTVIEADLDSFIFHDISDSYLRPGGNYYNLVLTVAEDDFGFFGTFGERMEGSAGGSFEFIENSSFYSVTDIGYFVSGYGKDANQAYFIDCYSTCWVNTIEGSDPETFEVLGRGVSRDKDHIYFSEYSNSEYKSYLGIDRDTFEFISFDLAKDKNSYYYFDSWNRIVPLQIIDEMENDSLNEYHLTDLKRNYLYDTLWPPFSELQEMGALDEA